MNHVYRIMAIEVDTIEDLSVARFVAHVKRHFPAKRKPELIGVRNFAWHHTGDDDWMDPNDFSRRGRDVVDRIHTAYRRGYVQLRVKLDA